MNINVNLFAAIPEIFVSGMIVLMLLIDAFVPQNKKAVNTAITILTLAVALFLQVMVRHGQQHIQFAFGDMFALDPLAYGMKLCVYISSIVIVLYVKQYISDKKLLKGEFYAIFLFAVLGMCVMISANNLLILYVGLELLSLALYTLVALTHDNMRATEAAMKFFILGALASGILLYGISLVYGATGQLQLERILGVIYYGSPNHGLLTFALVFIVAGLCFKLGLVPFHMWIPDVYEGALLPVTTIIGTVTKLAAVVFVMRFLLIAFVMLHKEWAVMLLLVACLSVFAGNVIAIAQTNIKRMLGYSTIAHMGFVAFGLMTVTIAGMAATAFYVVTYVITALACFGVLLLLSRDGFECEQISDLSGLNKSHPVYAGLMALAMLSMAGLPPLVGFYAKFTILQALVDVGYIKSAVFAVVMSLIGAFYYLRVIKVMYFDDKDANLAVSDATLATRTVLVANAGILLILGVLPGWLMQWCLHLITG